MNVLEKQKKRDRLIKIGFIIFLILAMIAAVAFIIAAKDVGQAILMKATL